MSYVIDYMEVVLGILKTILEPSGIAAVSVMCLLEGVTIIVMKQHQHFNMCIGICVNILTVQINRIAKY